MSLGKAAANLDLSAGRACCAGGGEATGACATTNGAGLGAAAPATVGAAGVLSSCVKGLSIPGMSLSGSSPGRYNLSTSSYMVSLHTGAGNVFAGDNPKLNSI